MSAAMVDARPRGEWGAPRQVRVPLGRRVVAAANLGLCADSAAASKWAYEGFSRALDSWDGPGTIVLAGNIFDLTRCEGASQGIRAALENHGDLVDALERFANREDRELFLLPGYSDRAILRDPSAQQLLAGLGIQVAECLDLRLESGAGERFVRVEPSCACEGAPSLAEVGTGLLSVDPDASWQAGIKRLVDPSSMRRFLTSRLLYRRFGRFCWWLLLPFAVATALRIAFVNRALDDVFLSRPGPAHAIHHAAMASWGSRLAVAGLISACELIVLAVVLAWLARRAWRALGGGELERFTDELSAYSRALLGTQATSREGRTVNDRARQRARTLVQEGYAGLVTGDTLQAELTHLTPGFFACAGAIGEVVEEQVPRLGLLPVFVNREQLAWIELETGAELHARLLLARSDQTPATILERAAVRQRSQRDTHPEVVAACPQGQSWPVAPDLSAVRNRSRRVRRWSAAAIFVAGAVDLLSAVTPPVRSHLHLLLQVLPLGASQAAGALVALAGVALLALARGVRRGQRRAWAISSLVLGATLVLHLVRGVDVAGSVLSALVLCLLLVNRREFQASTDLPSSRSAAKWLAGGLVVLIVGATFAAELALRFDRDRPNIALWRMGEAVTERLVGVQSVALPDRLNDFLSPSLLAIGFAFAVAALLLLTRPLVDRRRSAGHATWEAARDIVRRHGAGTLDYFALRSDKKWFFHRDSLVAYAIYGGVCLVAPDPIGPASEREQVWAAFRRFADHRGWVVAIMGAGEEWLPIYRATGMHEIYIGDEAVVDLPSFSLAGGHMKGLRQAFNRIAKYGYTATFHDPSRIDRAAAEQLTGLMSQSRRGEFERGFSMAIGRIFDRRDEGMLLCVVKGPDGSPAAMCQFVPASGIGGYSLDLMRRDRGEHPNGLIDFALVSTIEYLRERGCKGLSMNFAALRSVFEGERGDGISQRVERWALKRMSSFFQIESLWTFNSKYKPSWLPRYVVYDTAEHLVPVVLAILRAESLSEVPVIGKMIAASGRRARGETSTTSDASGASLLPAPATEPDEQASPSDAEPIRVPAAPERE